MITQAELKAYLHYDPETGVFTRNGNTIGTYDSHEYIVISVNNKRYRAHRLAWLYMTGEWPKKQIDHDDHVRDNNKWLNLNEATNQENHMNMSLRKDNTSGFTGVTFDKRDKTWVAQIKINYKRIHLGVFKNREAAIKRREFANALYGFHENHGTGK